MWKSTTPPNQHSRYGLPAKTDLEVSTILEKAGFTFPAADNVYIFSCSHVCIKMFPWLHGSLFTFHANFFYHNNQTASLLVC